jgi:hypothetical protein
MQIFDADTNHGAALLACRWVSTCVHGCAGMLPFVIQQGMSFGDGDLPAGSSKQPSIEACAEACRNHTGASPCAAWTYSSPGDGTPGICQLKAAVKAVYLTDQSVVSGHITGGAPCSLRAAHAMRVQHERVTDGAEHATVHGSFCTYIWPVVVTVLEAVVACPFPHALCPLKPVDRVFHLHAALTPSELDGLCSFLCVQQGRPRHQTCNPTQWNMTLGTATTTSTWG